MPVDIDDARHALTKLAGIARYCVCGKQTKKEVVELTEETKKLADTEENMKIIKYHMGILLEIIKICGCVSRDNRSDYIRSAVEIVRPFNPRTKACPEHPRRSKMNGGYHVFYVQKEKGMYERLSPEPYATMADAEKFASETSKMMRCLKKQGIEVKAMSASELKTARRTYKAYDL